MARRRGANSVRKPRLVAAPTAMAYFHRAARPRRQSMFVALAPNWGVWLVLRRRAVRRGAAVAHVDALGARDSRRGAKRAA